MQTHLFILYLIFALTILDIYIGFCHKLNRAYMKHDDLLSVPSGKCYKKLATAGGYLPRITSIETLLIIMTVLMVVVSRFTFKAMKAEIASRQRDTIICVLSTIQMSIAIFAIGCFLQRGGWELTMEMVNMMYHNELCDGFATRSTNRFFLSFGLFCVETILSITIFVCGQLLFVFGIYGPTNRVPTYDTLRMVEMASESDENQKQFLYEEMRSNSMAALKSSLRLSMLICSIAIVALHVSIIYYELTYPKIDPQYPKRQNYICFPQENDERGAAIMNVLRVVDIACSAFLVGICTAFQSFPAISKLHWHISILCALRFIIVLAEIIHVSSVNGDTQLDIILSVNEGICEVSDGQDLVYQALVIIFVLRCVKGYVTINMASLAYGNTIAIVLFNTENFDDDHESTADDMELQEFGNSSSK